jgi:anti-sigma B factor antagonist
VPLSIDVDHGVARPTFTLAGDLDLLTAPQLIGRVTHAIDRGAIDVVLDAEHLEFCDSSGLAALVRLAQQLGGGTVTLLDPRPIVRRLLEVSGMLHVFVVTGQPPVDDGRPGVATAATLSPA